MVKQIIDSETKEVTDIPVQKGDTVISKETSEKVLSMMESVVSEGTGKNAKVAGYRIGGKTGTSEDGVNTNKYVTSFCGVAPIDNPQVVVLVTLYNPTGEGGHQGGGVAAPVGGQIFSEILPYLEVNKQVLEEDDEEVIHQIQVPNIMGKSLEEAKQILKENNLEMYLENEEVDMENTYVKNQIPSSGITVNEQSKVVVEY